MNPMVFSFGRSIKKKSTLEIRRYLSCANLEDEHELIQRSKTDILPNLRKSAPNGKKRKQNSKENEKNFRTAYYVCKPCIHLAKIKETIRQSAKVPYHKTNSG
ncbi:hypothetical protein AVEN_151118-1 [Araneus ventricosus]|uniref:Uncharacterized protein n=1 Tax=Araneus ventricosus TaxID=182803 RepID=A0A4Y2K6Z4_ARAVE|nr:hypothetical protein AVEN_151118-1 [Araneus ventricosus]